MGCACSKSGSALSPAPTSHVIRRDPALWTASLLGRSDEVRKLLVDGADIEQTGLNASSPLHIAARQGHNIVSRMLLENGADVSAKNNAGRTILHHAARGGHEKVVQLLLDHRADVSAKDNAGETPLHSAAGGGHAAVARLLLDKGADEQAKSDDGRTPADIATHLETAAMLKAVAVRRAQCVAFAMGHQERLGAGSWVHELDAGVVRMVLEQV